MNNRKTDRIEKPIVKYAEVAYQNTGSLGKFDKNACQYFKKTSIDSISIESFVKTLNESVEEGLICSEFENDEENGFYFAEEYVNVNNDSFVQKEHYIFRGTLIYPFDAVSYQQDLKWINEYKTAKNDLEKTMSIYEHSLDYSLTNELAKYRNQGTSKFPPVSLSFLFIGITLLTLSILLLVSEYDIFLSDLNLLEKWNLLKNSDNKSMIYQIIGYTGSTISLFFFIFAFLFKRVRVNKIKRSYESLDSFNIKQNNLKNEIANKRNILNDLFEKRPFWWDVCHFRCNNDTISFGWFQHNQKDQAKVSTIDFQKLKLEIQTKKSKLN